MPDILQNSAHLASYRYSIRQLLELSSTARAPFDLSKFTFEAARSGVVPSLDSCAMSSRKSSASYTRSTNVEMVESSGSGDVIVFQGNRAVQPGRQPKIPPPAERQKDEGFARFLKKHSSPTHNRVTAGGRIVPMEPRSPPAFSLSSNVTTNAQAKGPTRESQDTRRSDHDLHTNIDQDMQRYAFFDANSEYLNERPPATTGETLTGINGSVLLHSALSQNPGLPHIDTGYATVPALSPVRTFVPSQHPTAFPLQQVAQEPCTHYNPYHSAVAFSPVMPAFQSYESSSWPMLEQQFPPQEQMTPTMSAYQMLAAWEQHYVNLDMQLKNIDRHRAMHSLDPCLAEQRKTIVQQRSDAKDFIKEYQSMLGIKRTTHSSQDSFTTGFNVEAPAYVPARVLEPVEASYVDSRFHQHQTIPDTEKSKKSNACRAIPIRPPPDHPKTIRDFNRDEDITETQGTADYDEWGVQNRPAPPDIQREQSRLSDMIQAEQQRLSASQPSDPSVQGMPIESFSDDTEAEMATTDPTEVSPIVQPIPRDNAQEMQQVMDAIGRPKGMITKVRLLDGRVINVEGQGLELSSDQQPQHASAQLKQEQITMPDIPLPLAHLTCQNSYNSITGSSRVSNVNGFNGKENISVAPRGRQKAATDAFLAQFNALEANVTSAAKPQTRSLRTASNGLVEDGNYLNGQSVASKKVSLSKVVDRDLVSMQPRMGQASNAHPVAGQDLSDWQTTRSMSTDSLNNKGYSSISVQNIHAVGRLPQNLDGAVDARQMAMAQLAAADKAKSPRLLRRHGNNGGVWYGPYCRDIFERARLQNNGTK